MAGSPLDLNWVLGGLPGLFFIVLVAVAIVGGAVDRMRHPERYVKKDKHGSGDDNWYE